MHTLLHLVSIFMNAWYRKGKCAFGLSSEPGIWAKHKKGKCASAFGQMSLYSIWGLLEAGILSSAQCQVYFNVTFCPKLFWCEGKKKKKKKPLAQHFAAALGLIMSLVSTAAMTPICSVLVNSFWYLCRKHAQSSYEAVSCSEVVGGSASDLVVTAVCLQTGFGQVEIYWPVMWDLLWALQVLPVWPWANHFSAFFSLLYLSCLFSLSGSSQEQRLYLTLCLYSA